MFMIMSKNLDLHGYVSVYTQKKTAQESQLQILDPGANSSCFYLSVSVTDVLSASSLAPENKKDLGPSGIHLDSSL